MNMSKLCTLLTLAIVFISGNTIAQHAGDLDLNFNGTGYSRVDFYGNTDVINDIAIQSDKKIVASGVAFTASWNIDVKIIRLNEDGTMDASFGTDGTATYAPQGLSYYEAHAMAVTLQPDGKILVAGGVLNNAAIFDVLLIRLNNDGTFDNTFGTGGIAVTSFVSGNDMAQDVIVDSDGKILIAGTADNADFNVAPMLARFNSDGSPDNTFGSDGFVQMPVEAMDNEFTSICLQNDGKILASGHYSTVSWLYRTLIARYNTDGSIDPSFADNGVAMVDVNGIDDEFFGMAINSKGEIVAGGFSNHSNTSFDMLIMKYDTDGNQVSDFGDNGIIEYHHSAYNVIYDLKIQPDDKILVAGSIGEFAPGDNDWALLRYNDNGTTDADFGTDGLVLTQFFGEQDEAQSVEIVGNDKIYIGGKTLNSSDGIRDFTVARYTNDLHVGNRISETAGLTIIPVSNGIFRIITDKTATAIEVYNIAGIKLESNIITNGNCLVDLSNQPAGIYMYRLSKDNKVIASGKLGFKL